MALLDLMESQYYELQLQLYDIQAEILQCEELLLAAQLDSIHRQMTGTLHADSRVVWARKIKHVRVYRLIFERNFDKKSHVSQKNTPTSISVALVRAFPDRQDEVVYYDAFESADDITEEDAEEREELRRLQAGARQLEARRGRIIAKRSYLRNKRVRASVNHVCACGRG